MLIGLAVATMIKGCVYLNLYDDGKERDTLCIVVSELPPPHGYKDSLMLLDCGAGIADKGFKITKTEPRYRRAFSSRCLEPRQDQKIIIKHLYFAKVSKK